MSKQIALPIGMENCIITPDMINSPQAAINWARERHSIFLKRFVKEQEKPWTKDPFLSAYRFCNTFREIDTVSLWVRDNIILPYEDSPQLWYYLAIARCINHTDTLQEIFDANAMQDTDKMYKIMKARGQRGEKVFTGAYIINSVFPKHLAHMPREKSWFVANLTIKSLLDNRKEISKHMKTSVEDAVNALQVGHGWGKFLSYQVAADLSYSDKWLKNAPDVNTFNSPGPGTCRGLNRLFGGGRRKEFEKRSPEWYSEKILELYDMFQKPKNWKVTSDDPQKGFAPISLFNCSSILCETDKYLRLFLGEGAPRSRYAGN